MASRQVTQIVRPSPPCPQCLTWGPAFPFGGATLFCSPAPYAPLTPAASDENGPHCRAHDPGRDLGSERPSSGARPGTGKPVKVCGQQYFPPPELDPGKLAARYVRFAVVFAAAALILDSQPAAAAQTAYERLWSDLLARPSGPGAFRFYLQPTMAALVALKSGVADARAGRSPYLWSLFKEPAERRARLREGLVEVRRIILLGITMDAIYQFAMLKAFYPLELIIVVFLLCVVPYLLLRGPCARIARWWLVGRTAA